VKERRGLIGSVRTEITEKQSGRMELLIYRWLTMK
jgi:hypothetical protein